MISSVVVRGHNIAIGDVLQSVTILKWDGKSLRTVAKDWTALQSLSLTVDENYIIQSEVRPLSPPLSLRHFVSLTIF
jgi:hypothetical protein